MSNANLASSANVEIYTWRFCPYCVRAKGLLDRKKVNYSEYAIDNDHEARAVMAQRAKGRNSLPQIFINKNPSVVSMISVSWIAQGSWIRCWV
jgi:glutaredoxin 3